MNESTGKELVVYIYAFFLHLVVKSCDLSQAENKITVVKS